VVELLGPDGGLAARGVAAFDAAELEPVVGLSSADLPVELRRPVVHADDLVAG
jgi:glutamate 5-kinase